ncbi:hypothetical protein [Candidatus Parabeggiatoa sp. HSG14]|uniref:hypothetical protein n=1 Tax=Candidatus Parabeggiatoa sp. HSG14 TaxID=3055593 RepID=UPI0025A8CEAB|nr:hypothetical protein [Thiotrichales bacterium HSG14]
MDEHEFHQALEALNQCPCPFEKAILSGRCACIKCQHLYIAERETVACTLPKAQDRCIELLKQLYQNARFALKQSDLSSPLSHIKAMKMQCGGLLALQTILFSKDASIQPIKDIDALVTKVQEMFGEFEKLPYQEMVKFISHYQVRHRKGGGEFKKDT